MGNSAQTMGTQLLFIQQLEDRHFGEIDIYRSEEGRFIMKVKRTHISGDKRQLEFQRVVQFVSKQIDTTIVPIIHIDKQQQKGICIQYKVSQIFTQYYNYTLKDLINSKKEVEEPELWCVLEGLLHLTTTLRRHKLAVTLDVDNVFLTLKGNPCVYLYHILSFEESINCNDYSMGQLTARILLQLAIGQTIQQTLFEQQNKQLLVPMSRVCNRYRLLGRFIKQLLNRQKLEQQILKEIRTLSALGKIKKSNGVKLNRFKYIIPDSSLTLQSQLQNLKNRQQMMVSSNPSKTNNQQVQQSRQRAVKSQSVTQTNEKPRNDNKSVMSELSNTKAAELTLSKQGACKMLTELQLKKQQNKLQMERFQLKKNQLLNHVDKENKQNLADLSTTHFKQLQKRSNKDQKKQVHVNHNSRRR